MAAELTGLYYQVVEEQKMLKAVDETRAGIEKRTRLECEKEQQGI